LAAGPIHPGATEIWADKGDEPRPRRQREELAKTGRKGLPTKATGGSEELYLCTRWACVPLLKIKLGKWN
jgi:hypothetical protein